MALPATEQQWSPTEETPHTDFVVPSWVVIPFLSQLFYTFEHGGCLDWRKTRQNHSQVVLQPLGYLSAVYASLCCCPFFLTFFFFHKWPMVDSYPGFWFIWVLRLKIGVSFWGSHILLALSFLIRMLSHIATLSSFDGFFIVRGTFY